tara:strand:+ start:15201 stop:18197 length:2997 start_codon:yes stop_codon:yes gene_type:complete
MVALNAKLEELLVKEGSDFVDACYRAILGRDPDEAGFRHHLDLLSRGRSKISIITGLLDSEECAAKGLRDVALVEAALDHPRSTLGKLKRALGGRPVRPNADVSNLVADPLDRERGASYIVSRTPVAEWNARPSKVTADGMPFERLWFDLTTSMQWQLGVVGIIRAELELACNLKRMFPSLRFSMQAEHGFAEIPDTELAWLLNADNVAEAYMRFFGRSGGAAQKIRVKIPDTQDFFHPYSPNDVIFSMGWKDSQKERLFSRLKDLMPDVRLGYLIYDIIMLRPETEHFYAKEDRSGFEKYLKWVSYNCDFLMFGGENTKKDVEAWQHKRGWPVLPGRAIRFGSDIVEVAGRATDEICLVQLEVSKPFILAVGTAEPRKNYSTLYRAYILAQELSKEPLPQLVICGQNGHRISNLTDQIARDPRVSGKILRRTPSDEQLSALYRNCLFTLLPSFYEGWSLTLPESFAYGKFCLCADNPPLRETGADFAEYVDPIDVMAWAKAIIKYAQSDESLIARERHIAAAWRSTTWAQSANLLFENIVEISGQCSLQSASENQKNPSIWMDLSLSFLNWNSSLTGVTRVELMYAKTLRQIVPSTRFFANDGGHFFEIDPSYLTWMDDNDDLSQAYADFNAFWHNHEKIGNSFRSPLRGLSEPQEHPAYLSSFPPRSVVFFSGIDFGFYNEHGEPELSYTHQVKRMIPAEGQVLLAHFMHDFTPTDWPQIHKSETVVGYEPFCDFVSNHFDYLAYGGITAQRDGEALQKRRGWRVPKGDPVPLGFDIQSSIAADQDDDRNYLQSIGINSDFVVAVGTLEPRKNHETLYRAYLLMEQRHLLHKPLQMIFIGKHGWNNDDFLTTLASDERVKRKIITLNPSDRGLDILYRHSLFTLLPSFYEGWSLPLPESLAYGKFCLVSDTPPLRERGGHFVEFIHPLDAARWSDRIAFYANHQEALVPLQENIKNNWSPVSWVEATQILRDKLYRAYENQFSVITSTTPRSLSEA